MLKKLKEKKGVAIGIANMLLFVTNDSLNKFVDRNNNKLLKMPWTSLICVSSPKCVYMCVKRCPSQTPNASILSPNAFVCVSPNAFICVSPNAFICVSPNAFICVSPNAFICVSPNAFICVSPNAFTCVSPNVSADATELASLAYLCSLRSHVFLTV